MSTNFLSNQNYDLLSLPILVNGDTKIYTSSSDLERGPRRWDASAMMSELRPKREALSLKREISRQ